MKSRIRAILFWAIISAPCLAADPNEPIRYWKPTDGDIATAEEIARTFCWHYLSDQQRTNNFEACIVETNGTISLAAPRPPPPQDFTIEQTMFSSYARRHSGFYREGKKLLYTQYFDPQKFPDWETMGPVLGGFPAYFTVTVDIANETVAEHYASPL